MGIGTSSNNEWDVVSEEPLNESHKPLDRTPSNYASEITGGIGRGLKALPEMIVGPFRARNAAEEFSFNNPNLPLVTQVGTRVLMAPVHMYQDAASEVHAAEEKFAESQTQELARRQDVTRRYKHALKLGMTREQAAKSVLGEDVSQWDRNAERFLSELEGTPILGGIVKYAERGGTTMFSPESFGATAEGATMLEAPKLIHGGAGKVGKAVMEAHEIGIPLRDLPKTTARILLQDAAGAGREPITSERRAHGESARAEEIEHGKRVAKARDDHKVKLADIDREYKKAQQKASEKHRAEVAEIKQKHADDVTSRETKIAESRAAYDEGIAKAHEEWARKAREARAEVAGVEADVSHRKTLEGGQVEYGRLALDNLQSAYDRIGESFRARWKSQSALVGDHAKVDTAPLLAAVQDARSMLAGTPESAAIINQIEKVVADPKSFTDTPEGPVPNPGPPLTWDVARTNAHAMFDAASNATDANMRRALFHVYDAYDKQLQAAAEQAGVERSRAMRDPTGMSAPNDADLAAGRKATADYVKLKQDWRQFKTDWDDAGSPLKAARQAKGPRDLAKKLKADADNRIGEALGRYTRYRAEPKLVAEIRRLGDEIDNIPRPKKTGHAPDVAAGLAATERASDAVEKAGGGPNLRGQLERTDVEPIKLPKGVEKPPVDHPPVPEPVFPPEPVVTPPQYPELKLPTAKEIPPVNPFSIRMHALERFSGSPWGFLDIVMTYRILEKMLLKNDSSREWIASQVRSGDPDYLKPNRAAGEKVGLPRPAATRAFAQAVKDIKQLDEGGKTATRDFFNRSISARGYRQRMAALFPELNNADLDEITRKVVELRKTAAKEAGVTLPPDDTEPAPPASESSPDSTSPVIPANSTSSQNPHHSGRASDGGR